MDFQSLLGRQRIQHFQSVQFINLIGAGYRWVIEYCLVHESILVIFLSITIKEKTRENMHFKIF